jgi:hypothetical protein
MDGSKVNTHTKNCKYGGLQLFKSVILPGTLYNGSKNSVEIPCSLEAYRSNPTFTHKYNTEICALLGHTTASNGNPLSTFRDNVSVPYSRVKKSKKSGLGVLIKWAPLPKIRVSFLGKPAAWSLVRFHTACESRTPSPCLTHYLCS